MTKMVTAMTKAVTAMIEAVTVTTKAATVIAKTEAQMTRIVIAKVTTTMTATAI